MFASQIFWVEKRELLHCYWISSTLILKTVLSKHSVLPLQTLEISGRLQFLHGHSHNFQMSPTTNNLGRHSSSSSSAESRGASRMGDQSPSGYSRSSFGLFGVCSPLGSLPSLNGSQRETSFKTKHKMDLTVTSMDTRYEIIFQKYE